MQCKNECWDAGSHLAAFKQDANGIHAIFKIVETCYHYTCISTAAGMMTAQTQAPKDITSRG